MLKESLTRQMKIKDQEAGMMIDEYVKEIIFRLKKNHYCRLEGIGYLMTKGEDQIILKDTFWKKCKIASVSAVCV